MEAVTYKLQYLSIKMSDVFISYGLNELDGIMKGDLFKTSIRQMSQTQHAKKVKNVT